MATTAPLGNIYFDVDRANYWEFNKIPENSLKNLRKLKSYEKALYWFYEAQNFHRKFTGIDTYAFVSDEIQLIEEKFASIERKRIERESNRKSGVYHLGESARDVKNFFQDLYNSEPITNLKDMLDKFKKDFSEGYSD